MNITLESFIKQFEEMGLTFPCGATEFVARAAYFLVIHRVESEDFENALDDLCWDGIGPNWRDQ